MSRFYRAGWLAYAVLLVGVLATMRFGGPEWALNFLIGLAFLLVVPLGFLAVRARWRGR